MKKIYGIDCNNLIFGRLFCLIIKLFLNKNNINYNKSLFNSSLKIIFFNIEKIKFGKLNSNTKLFFKNKRPGYSKFRKIEQLKRESLVDVYKKKLIGMLPNNSFSYKILNRCSFVLGNDDNSKLIVIPNDSLKDWISLCKWFVKTVKE